MKMKLNEVIEHYNGLTAVDGIATRKFPVKLSYGISKNIRKLESEVETYQRERIRICENLAAKDEDGRPVMIKTESGAEVYDIPDEKLLNQEIKELLDTEADIDIHMVDESVLDQCGESERYDIPSAKDLMIIGFMIA